MKIQKLLRICCRLLICLWIQNVIENWYCLVLSFVLSQITSFVLKKKTSLKINHFENVLYWTAKVSLLLDYLCCILCLHAEPMVYTIVRQKKQPKHCVYSGFDMIREYLKSLRKLTVDDLKVWFIVWGFQKNTNEQAHIKNTVEFNA